MGWRLSQKKKNVARLHEALGGECLEVSTKSDVVIGTKLSAFNLKLDGHTLENIFQSSKVFENGGPYRDLLNVSPKEAKRDQRLKSSGNLKGFEYDNYLNLKRLKIGEDVILIENEYESNNGLLKSQTYGNGQVINYTYDENLIRPKVLILKQDQLQ